MSIKTPKNRKEIEHNMYLLQERGLQALDSKDQDRIGNFAAMTWPHLKEVKTFQMEDLLPTINEQARLQGNMENTDLWKFSQTQVPKDESQ
ncbi:hypothetical protein EJ377_01040 [Chryseobacterium arthrosphaerae]|uniref:Uncharacterized protein n=1 Tax=Chryseobacterium arthrosphaerae TaxID=651561 RepID=A0A432DYM8_9FLAO|nr:hypothetical protein EJ377_01040 [Chryseobacterium arthrosphaerae]